MHVAPATLYLVPYFRFSAEEVLWKPRDTEGQRRSNVREVANWLGLPVPSAARDDDIREPDAGPAFASRVLEKNFVARRTTVVPHSLGVRPAALTLRRFDPTTEQERTVVVAADLTPKEAQARGAGEPDPKGRRALLRSVLQIVYFPFWVVPIREKGAQRVAVVDAVAGSIVRDDVDPTEVEALAAGKRRRARTVGFRPLVCPNCGWDLPFRPDDVLYHCSSCSRGWLSRGDQLVPSSFFVAGGAEAHCYLPVWRLSLEGHSPVYAPAFRCRRLKSLYDLGARLTRREPILESSDEIPAKLMGCALDELDARVFARFLSVAVAEEAARGATRPDLPSSLDRASAELVWLPFASDGYALREGITGSPVPFRLLDVPLPAPGGSRG